MITLKQNEDIALSTADAIVNASNGIGYMGGQAQSQTKTKKQAEIDYKNTHGILIPWAMFYKSCSFFLCCGNCKATDVSLSAKICACIYSWHFSSSRRKSQLLCTRPLSFPSNTLL